MPTVSSKAVQKSKRINSRAKGQRGEREIIDFLQPIVDDVFKKQGQTPPLLQRNTLQSDRGGQDIIATDQFGKSQALKWLSSEVKTQKVLDTSAWWRQTLAQSGTEQLPVLFFKASRGKWKVMTWGAVGIGSKSEKHLSADLRYVTKSNLCVVEISLLDFGFYFRARLAEELKKLCSVVVNTKQEIPVNPSWSVEDKAKWISGHRRLIGRIDYSLPWLAK